STLQTQVKTSIDLVARNVIKRKKSAAKKPLAKDAIKANATAIKIGNGKKEEEKIKE
ncbi:17805_t:CDS:2, partial [Entrophospora sp. SA101]